ncbi:ATP-binding protein [Puia sp.]|uniref:ATP-binding protein n=1 Tax=Puia sp. TaxID=2045100 RepID=UPI002F3F8578
MERWKQSSPRKPLIIWGARQVGKTWLMKEFGRTHYRKCAYVNLESNAVLRSLFTTDFDIRRILAAVQIETGVPIDAADTLVLFDEIQEAPGALTCLKYFYENAPEYHVIAAGSLLGVALMGGTSFPVGKVAFLDLRPLDFPEFIEAVEGEPLAGLLRGGDWPLITGFKTRFIDLLKQYYFVGGMPEAVYSYAEQRDFGVVREIQKRILAGYEQDFAKHPPKEIVPRIRMLWQSVPAQLAKENRKFIYGLVKEGARAREYELALNWLIDCGLLYKVNNITKPGIPLKAYEEMNAFKLFLVDIGLLGAMADLDVKTLLDGNLLFEEFKGALTEQFVLQQLMAKKDAGIFYWSPEGARSSVDFVVQYWGKVVPIEVKAAENLQAKSLKVYYQKYKPTHCIRTSMSDYRKEEWMTNLPLYAIAGLFGEIK